MNKKHLMCVNGLSITKHPTILVVITVLCLLGHAHA